MLWRYLAGAASARTADEMSGPALLIAGLAVTGSPVVASWLLAGLTVSAAAGGPLLGVLLDRARRPGRLLAGCLVAYAGGLLVIVSGLGRLPEAALVAVAVAAGVVGPALTGGWTAQLPAVTGAARPGQADPSDADATPPGGTDPADADATRLGRANAMDAMTYNVAGLAGPALAGVIAGGPAAVLVCVALLVAALPAAWALPASAGVKARRGVGEELREGFGAILGNPALLRATAGSMVSCAGTAMLVVSAPVLGDRLTGSTGPGALLLAVTAACGLAANALVARARGPRRWDALLVRGTAVTGVGMALAAVAAVSGTYWVAVVAAGVVGLGEGPQLTALFSVRHREAPERLRAQVFTTGASLKITSFAVGSAVAGPLAAYSVGAALLAGAAAQAAAVAVLTVGRRSVRDV
ncbi:MFS transporter [Nonomuraea sp. LP-02]|uniref:MFS transporter n=1 Tax=Nonomuraea sp. LP-02 TaxID=3097960 RepID=UPI002E313264|nr:MFS transporter [Nonomuraea sp. LP-02]MED7923214.1 MFS transporter [Nonomuraea sp. LP-02]